MEYKKKKELKQQNIQNTISRSNVAKGLNTEKENR